MELDDPPKDITLHSTTILLMSTVPIWESLKMAKTLLEQWSLDSKSFRASHTKNTINMVYIQVL